jgi:hypothetical protein
MGLAGKDLPGLCRVGLHLVEPYPGAVLRESTTAGISPIASKARREPSDERDGN